MKWLIALMFAAAVTFSGSAIAFHPEPDRYVVGKTQVFVGIVCKTQISATHIFETWEKFGVRKAREVFTIYNGADECFSASIYQAYFVEQLGSIAARHFQGLMQIVLLFSISPSENNERTDYLVTWVDPTPPMPQA